MKDTPAPLVAHYQQVVATRAKCVIIKLRNGVFKRFTEHTKDLVIDGNLYVTGAGISRSAIQQKSGASKDNMDLMGIIDSAEVTDKDILSNLYQDAEMWTFEVNYKDVDMGKNKLTYGRLGEITYGDDGTFKIKHRGITSLFENAIGRKYGKLCHYTLGDTGCGVDTSLAAWKKTGTLTAITSRRRLEDTSRTEADNFFQYGELTMTSGANSGLSVDVKSNTDAGIIVCVIPFPFDLLVGESYEIIAGCNHKLKDKGDVWGSPYTGHCGPAKFDNAARFPGHPEIPGADHVLGGGKI